MARKNSDRVAEIRRKANEQRRIEETRRKRQRVLIQTSIIVAVVLVVGGITWAVIAMNQAATSVTQPQASTSVTVQGQTDVPFEVGTGDNGGTSVRVGSEDAPVTIDLYEDFSCPHCQEYEAAVGDTLQQLIADGTAVVAYHPVQVVASYGIRAGSVATCVAVNDPENWLATHAALFEAHGEESESWRAGEFTSLLAELGVTDEETLDCVDSGTYENWIRQNTETAQANEDFTGTPTLLLNGEKTDPLGAEQLKQAVEELAAG
ncbi:thioredoxin domain-containing protein [Okibacterium endophyticum]